MSSTSGPCTSPATKMKVAVLRDFMARAVGFGMRMAESRALGTTQSEYEKNVLTNDAFHVGMHIWGTDVDAEVFEAAVDEELQRLLQE